MESSEPSTSAKDNININPTNESNRSDANNEKTSGLSVDDFLSTGRTGRRNALPDILEQKSSHTNTADLPNQLQKLNFEGFHYFLIFFFFIFFSCRLNFYLIIILDFI